MKRITIWCLLALGCLAAAASAYQVQEEPEEVDETLRGKRQENSAVVIDSIFNVPIAAIERTSTAAQTLSPQKPGTIDGVLKIPVSTLQAVSNLIKNRYQETTPLTRQLQRRYDQPASTSADPDALLRSEIRRQLEAQRDRQRLYQRQLQRQRMEQLLQHNLQLQQRILEADAREQHRFYRDPYGFNTLGQWLVGPRGLVLNRHSGHGDGHVYQYYDARKPLPFGREAQANDQAAPTKPTPSLTSSSTTTTTTPSSVTSSDNSSSTTSTTTDSSLAIGKRRSTDAVTPLAHVYAVREVVDEGANPFTWPNWFGILNALGLRAQPTDARLPSRDKSKPTSALDKKLQQQQPDEQDPKDEDYYKSKYAKARKNYAAREEEITGNEIDGDVHSAEADGKLFLPSN